MKTSTPLLNERPSYRQHRRQFAWQILAPVLLSTLVLVVLGVWAGVATFRGDGDVGRWAALATIWLLILPMVLGILVLVLLIGATYLLIRARQAIPPLAARVQFLSHRLRQAVQRGADITVKPILYLEEIGAGARAFLKPRKDRTE